MDVRRVAVVGLQQLLKTGPEIVKEPLQIEAQVTWSVRFEVFAGRIVHPKGAAEVAVAEVKQRDRGLNEPLIKALLRADGLLPEFFPHIMAFEEVTPIKQP